MTYTTSADVALERRIARDLDLIRSELLRIFGDNIVAIFLCGGFGRGEGSVVCDDRTCHPYNDYDIFLVTKRRISQAQLRDIGKNLAATIGIRFIDIGSIKFSGLSRLSPTIFTFDLHSSVLLYGSSEIVDEIPLFASDDIPIEEAHKILRNRIICFLELLPDDWLRGEPLEPNDHRAVVLQISKAVVAAAIAHLVHESQYVSSYREQSALFSNLQVNEETKEIVRLSYALKLGEIDPLSMDIRSFWFMGRAFFLDTFSYHLKNEDVSWASFIKRSIKHEEGSLQSIYVFLKGCVKLVLYHERTHGERIKRRIEAASLSVILALMPTMDVDRHYMKYLTTVLPRKCLPLANWNEAKRCCAELWQIYHH